MRYIKYCIRTVPAAEDLIVSAMEDIGLHGAEIRDNVPLSAAEKEQIYTYDVDDPVDDNNATVSFYVEEGEDPETTKERMARVLKELSEHTDIGSGEISVEITDDADWLNSWKQYFHRFFIGEDILVIPSWEEADEDEKARARYVLNIDPGTAFGTGTHETTQLAALAIRKYMKEGDKVLDIGTGSGILSILSLMFGAGSVTGIDVDPFTEEAVKMNVEGNDVDASRFEFILGNLLEDEDVERKAGDDADIVVANILPVVLEPLTPIVPRLLKKGGKLIMSGILTTKMDKMCALLEENGFSVIEKTEKGEWGAVIAE